MQTANRRDIKSALGFNDGRIMPFYKSHLKRDLETGFGVHFDSFGELAEFLVDLGSQAMYRDCDSLSTRTDYLTIEEAKRLASGCQVDAIAGGLAVFFPGWELTDD